MHPPEGEEGYGELGGVKAPPQVRRCVLIPLLPFPEPAHRLWRLTVSGCALLCLLDRTPHPPCPPLIANLLLNDHHDFWKPRMNRWILGCFWIFEFASRDEQVDLLLSV